jgi:hypothetical protein
MELVKRLNWQLLINRTLTTYRDRISALIRGLANSEGTEEAREALRGLIETIVLTPRENGPGLTIDLHGALASLLLLATGAPLHRVAQIAAGGQKRQNSATAEFQGVDMIGKSVLVAGGRLDLDRTSVEFIIGTGMTKRDLWQ